MPRLETHEDDEHAHPRDDAATAPTLTPMHVLAASDWMHRQTLERLQAVVAACPLAIAAYDRHGVVQMWNPAAERTFGWTEAEVLGRPNPVVPETKQDESTLFRTSVLGGEPITGVQVQRQTKAGGLIDVSLSTASIRDAQGLVTGVIAIFQDITQEKRAERELLDAHEQTDRLLSAIASVLIGIGPDGRIARWNGAASRTFRRKGSDVLGLTLRECGIQWEHEKIERRVAECRHSRGPISVHDVAYVVDGKERFLDLVLNPVTAGREAGSVVMLAADVTEHKLLQVHLAQAQKLESIGQLAAGIAHEINTPMQYVGDNVRFMREHWPVLRDVLTRAAALSQARADASIDPLITSLADAVASTDVDYLLSEMPTALDQTLEGVERVSGIVRAMKEFSHPGGEERTPLDVNHVIETTIRVASHEWKYVCEIVTDLALSLPPVNCLPGELHQVILNLLVNAVHAIADAATGYERKGRITIRTRTAGECVLISVADTGVGIPEPVRGRVFDPFFTTKDVGRGTGQGLAIAHDVIVQKHRGRIWFDTEVGTGTTFYVQLPVDDDVTCGGGELR